MPVHPPLRKYTFPPMDVMNQLTLCVIGSGVVLTPILVANLPSDVDIHQKLICGKWPNSGVVAPSGNFLKRCIPAGPIGPSGPTEPCTPAAPCGPCAPVAPVPPVAPVAPVFPAGPCGPGVPV